MSSDPEDEAFDLVRTVIVEEGSICEHTGDDGPTINVDVDDVADKIVRKLREEGLPCGAAWHEQRFGTPSTVTEQDAVRDAYVAKLEDALRQIGTIPALGASIARTLDQCILIARNTLAEGDVKRIPDGIKWPHGKVVFTRYPAAKGDWHLIGPAVLLEPGTVIEVERFSGTRKQDVTLVGVGQIVAERTVVHKDAGPVRYVIARISRAVRD